MAMLFGSDPQHRAKGSGAKRHRGTTLPLLIVSSSSASTYLFSSRSIPMKSAQSAKGVVLFWPRILYNGSIQSKINPMRRRSQ